MTHVFHRHTQSLMPEAASASGLEITDTNGKTYIDACGGAAVSCLGHNHPEVIAAVAAQMSRLDYVHSSFFTSRAAEELAEFLLERAPVGMSHAFLVSGGSEAMEAALKMARQYYVEIGQPQRCHFIGRRQSYHGNTLGALAVGGNAMRRAQFAPLLFDVTHVAPCYEYRDRLLHESAEEYGLRLVGELEAEILRLGPENVIGFCVETVVGATLGAVPAVPGYFKGIRAVCERHGVLLIADEIMCGMGRTGAMHAVEQEGIVPDLMAVAKGLGGGYQAIGAVLVQRKIHDVFTRGSGRFMHGHTYMGHPVACAAALQVQRIVQRDQLVDAARLQGHALHGRLSAALGGHRHVGDIRGRGLLQAFEIVADRNDKIPFAPTLQLNARIREQAMARGLLVYAMGGTIDGRRGDHILLAPPFTVQDKDLDLIIDRLADAIDAAFASLPSA